jgi:outer membrane lipoprotein LolB
LPAIPATVRNLTMNLPPALGAARVRLRVFALSLVVVVAGGCSTLAPPAPVAGAPNLANRPLAPSFTASGRVAARVTGDSARGFSGGFTWSHGTGGDTIELLTPLGQIAARMRVTPAGAEIETSDGRKTVADDPERFFAEVVGVGLPLAALPNWMQAVPLAATPFRAEADAKGRPVILWQSGWQIQYADYADDAIWARPTRLQLNQGDVEARMIIAEWSTP